MSRELYQQSHRFDISLRSLSGMQILRSELSGIQRDFPSVQGLGFYGSRTKGRAREFDPEKPDQLGSDFDVCVFYDGSMIDANASATDNLPNNQSQLEVDLQRRIINFVTTNMENVKQGKGSTVLIDISEEATQRSLSEFYDSVRLQSDPWTLNCRKLLARFFLGIGVSLYENRTYILDELKKQPKGDELFGILMQRLHAFERTRDDDPEHPNKNPVPYEGYPKTIEKARGYFITRNFTEV